MSNTTYVLTVDNGNQSSTYDFADKEMAIAIAKERYKAGAFSVDVCHYTNSGNNCITDFHKERE